MKILTNTLNYVLPIAAFILSIYAVFSSRRFNRKTIKMTEEHFKKSIEPILCVWNEALPEHNKLVLRNGGPGPAIIKKVEFQVNNKSYDKMEKLFEENIVDPGGNKYKHSETEISRLKNYALVSNGEVTIFKYFFNSPNGRKEFEDLTRKISLIVYYEDLYKKALTFTEESINIT